MVQESLPEVDVIPNQDAITKQEDKESMESLLDVCDDRSVKALEKTPTVIHEENDRQQMLPNVHARKTSMHF